MAEKQLTLKLWISKLTKNRREDRELFAPTHKFILFYLLVLMALTLGFQAYGFFFLYMGIGLVTTGAAWLNAYPYKKIPNILGKMLIPGFMITSIFSSFGPLLSVVHPSLYDSILLSWDMKIFGVNPTLWVSENLHHPFAVEWFQLAYFSYFFYVMGATVVSFFKESESNTEFVVFSITFGFLLSYIGYLVFPALGPRDPVDEPLLAHQLLTHYQEPLKGLFFTPYIREGLNAAEGVKQNAFPSGHVALTLLAIRHYFRLSKRVFAILLPVGISIIVATIYCRYHYVVDVMAGILLFLLVSAIDKKAFAFIKKIPFFPSKKS